MPNTNTELVIVFKVCQNSTCSSIDLTDFTEVYNALTNPTGYGGDINPQYTDILSAVLEVTRPDDTVITLDLIVLSGGSFPNNTETPVVITPASLGYSDGKFPDGIYEFSLTYSGDTITTGAGELDIDWTTTTVVKQLFDCQVRCCLDKLFASIESDECIECSSKTLERVEKAYLYLKGAQRNFCCGRRKKALKLLNAAKFLCSLTSCSSC